MFKKLKELFIKSQLKRKVFKCPICGQDKVLSDFKEQSKTCINCDTRFWKVT